MNFKLSYKKYILIKSVIWLLFSILFISLYTKHIAIEIISSVMLTGLIIQLTIINFINNWYYYNKPKLLDWFRLTTFFVIIYSFYNCIDNINKDTLSFPDYIIDKTMFFPALLIVLIGLIGLKISEIIALLFIKKKKKSNVYIKYTLKNETLFFSFSFLIGGIQLVLLFQGVVGYGTFQEHTTSSYSFLLQITTTFSIILLSLFSIFKYMYGKNNIIFNSSFLFFFIVQIVFGLLSGMKESTILPFIIVFIPYISSGKIIPKKWLILSVLALIVIYPINDNYRTILKANPSIGKYDAYKAAFALTVNNNFSEMVNEGSESYSSRLNLFPFLMYSYEHEENWTYYKNMDRYIYLPVSFLIPRTILPDKPKSETGGVFNEMVYGVDTNSITPTTYGWAYFEGGYSYVFIAFLLFGLFISIIESIIDVNNIFHFLLYIMIIVLLMKVEADIYFIISDILQKTLVLYFFTRILINKKVCKVE